ncbi:MAG TPA: hypothetical protein VJN18_04660 [Polyangiaceae bacterium]|nr:hypothetical protein [Polyangiaceae bacterium]
MAKRVLDHALAGARLADDDAEAALLAVHAQDFDDLALMGQKREVFRRKRVFR